MRHRVAGLGARIAVCGLLAGCQDRPAARAAAADDMLGSTFVVDANLNYHARRDASCRKDCQRAPFPGSPAGDFATFKQVTGVNLASTTFTTERSQTRAQQLFLSGKFRNAVLVQTRVDLERVVRDKVHGQLMATQKRIAPDWQLGGDLGRLDAWHRNGLRVFLIAYSAQEGHGPVERLGFAANDGDERGLTDLGRRAVARLNELGMVVDVSHCNRATTLDVAKLSTKPIVSTHANVESIVPIRRNKDDDEIVAIAATGGVFAVTAIQWMTVDGAELATVDDLIDHIDHVVALVGVEHVGVSADSWVDGWDGDSKHRPGPELNSASRWRHLARRMLARGYTETQVRAVLGGNMLRVLREVLPP